ncbi:MAG: hypothetical protein DMG34_00935 [Acidobacteria bacterium]|nr:MAG: hypothetical protein DMG34_00935 [Acidobacteriota bacterium]
MRAESHFREGNCKRVTLDTTAPLESAIRLYERFGLAPSEKIENFFGMPLAENRPCPCIQECEGDIPVSIGMVEHTKNSKSTRRRQDSGRVVHVSRYSRSGLCSQERPAW